MNLQTEAQRRLKAYIEKVERLESEKKALAADISEIYAEAGSVYLTKHAEGN